MIYTMYKTHNCGELNKSQIEQKVALAGWVHRRRDHGGIIFVDLRDSHGLTQIKFDPEINKEAHAQAESLRSEWVISVKGKVIGRPNDMINSKMKTGGIEKYFQIAPCFRDEDTRIDRHYGEFYQLDMEMSFVEQDDIFNIMEPLMINLTKIFSSKEIVGLNDGGRFKQISWRDAMNRYGSDKPDLRFDMEIKNITEIVKDCEFKVFADMAAKEGHVVHALKVEGAGNFTRKEIDDLEVLAKNKGAKGLAYIQVKGDKLQSPIVKFLGEDLAKRIVEKLEAKTGDVIFFGAGAWREVCEILGVVRNECGARLGLKDNTKAAWAWVVDFPMYEYSEIEEGRIDFGHNPFSMPQGGLKALQEKNPFEILAWQFDLVINGFK